MKQRISIGILTCFAGLLLFSVSLCRADTPKVGKEIRLQAHHSKIITLAQPALRVGVANPKIVDFNLLTPRKVLIVSKAKVAASTTLMIWHSEDSVAAFDIQVYTIVPSWILETLEHRIAELAPNVKVSASPASTYPEEEKIILSGTVPSIDIFNQVKTIADAFEYKYANLIRVAGPQQVQLKVIIAEVSRSGLKQMGLTAINLNNDGIIGALSKDTDIGVEDGNFKIPLEGLSAPFKSAFNLALLHTGSDFYGIISVLKTQGLARTLASPTLVTLNGQKAEFQVGGSYPVPIQQDGGITIEDKEYGVLLKFTPYIIDNNTITLEVIPEVSSPDYSMGVTSAGTTVPGQTSRKASATLQLKSGQTFAMAGLLKEDFYQSISKVPFLGDVPYLGTLFTSKETKHTENELVIMVTPTIVRPLDPGQAPDLPGQNLPSVVKDTDFFLKNKLVSEPEMSRPGQSPMTFKGKTGFVK